MREMALSSHHLDGRGFSPKVLLWCDPYRLRGDAAINYEILSKTDVTIVACADERPASGLRTS